MTEPRPADRRRSPGARRGPSGFDRIKTAEQRGDAGDPAERSDGRAALFGGVVTHEEGGTASAVSDGSTGASGHAPGTATPSHGEPSWAPVLPVAAVHCRACDATSPLDILTALRGALPLVVVPWADHPWWAPCPACGQRTWLRPEVHRGGDA